MHKPAREQERYFQVGGIALAHARACANCGQEVSAFHLDSAVVVAGIVRRCVDGSGVHSRIDR